MIYILIILAIVSLSLSLVVPSFDNMIVIIGGRPIHLSFKNIPTTLNLIITVASLAIAVQTYWDSIESGPKQQAMLEKTKTAIDSSTAALQAVLKISKDQQAIGQQSLATLNNQLMLADSQWRNQQMRMALRPELKLSYRLKTFLQQSTGNKYVDSSYDAKLSTKNEITDVVSADNSDFESFDDSRYGPYRHFPYKTVGENTKEGIVFSSKLFTEKDLHVHPIVMASTRLEDDNLRYFYLDVSIINVGSSNAEGLVFTVGSLSKGVSITGEGIDAPEVMEEITDRLVYSKSSKKIPLLTVYKMTKESAEIPLKVKFEDPVLNRISAIEIGVYDKNVRVNSVVIKFRIIPYSF